MYILNMIITIHETTKNAKYLETKQRFTTFYFYLMYINVLYI